MDDKLRLLNQIDRLNVERDQALALLRELRDAHVVGRGRDDLEQRVEAVVGPFDRHIGPSN